MSGLVEFKVTGLAALEAQLTELGTELGAKALAQAARQAFKPVVAAAKAMVPVSDLDDDHLRDSIRLTVVKPKGDGSVVVVGIRIAGGNPKGARVPPARRWHFVELGTAHQAAHPYLRPALDQNAAAVLDLLKTEIVKSIQKALRKRAKAATQ